MILNSIGVEGWRCFADAVEVGPFGEGLNVVHGPNGIGKSTLFLALVRGLFDGHKVAGEAMRMLRPWGRDLGPSVTIELRCGAETYRLKKQFLSTPRAELSRLEHGRFVRLAEGTAADERARELLCGESPGRGASDRRHWGLAQVLWAPQGEMTLGQLTGAAKQTIQQSLGAQVAGEETSSVERKIAELYGKIFTPTGKLKTGADGPALGQIAEQLKQAKERCERLRSKLSSFDDAVHGIESLRLLTEQSRAKLSDLEGQERKAQQRAEEYQEVLNERERQSREAAAVKSRYDELNARVETIKAAIDDSQKAEQLIASLSEQVLASARELQLRSAEADQAHASAEKIRTERDAVRAAIRKATEAGRCCDLTRQLESVSEQLSQLDQAQAELKEVVARRAEIVAPNQKELRQLEQALRDRDDARTKLDASLITVVVRTESACVVEPAQVDAVSRDETPEGMQFTLRGSPTVTFRIPGIASIQASGPSGSVESLRRAWEQAAAKADSLLQRFDGRPLEQLQRDSVAAGELERQMERLQARIDALLNRRSIDQLRIERAELGSQLESVLAANPEWRDARPQPAAMTAEAERVEREFTDRIDAAENARQQAVVAVTSVAERVARHEENLKNAKQQLQAAEQRLTIARNDGRTDEQRREQLGELALSWHGAQASLAKVEQRLAAFGGDPRDEVKVLQRQVQALRDETATVMEKLHREEGKLRTIIDEAPYSALSVEEEAIAELEARLAREQLQADAIRLLHDTLARRKRELVESLVGPVRQRAMQTLARITGSRFERLEFSESFEVSGIVPRNSTEPVALDQLSGGEREQAYFAVRLALADIAMQGERQLVVLDDVFTFTDTARLARIVQILEEAAERFQIVMLTCHPERYRGLPGARFFDLEQIVAGRTNAVAADHFPEEPPKNAVPRPLQSRENRRPPAELFES